MLLRNGCCVMKCQLFTSIGFKVGTAGVILRYKEQDCLVLFLSEGLIPVFKRNFSEGCLNKVFSVSSLKRMCFEVCDALRK